MHIGVSPRGLCGWLKLTPLDLSRRLYRRSGHSASDASSARRRNAGWTLGVASTSAEDAVQAILDHVVGPTRAARFDVVLAGDCVPNKKPAPDIYQLALERLGIGPSDALVIEDSRNGLLAATRAGLACVVTVNGYTQDEDSSEAVLVVSSLGDPGGEVTRVLADRSMVRPGDHITLDDLDACMRPPSPAGAGPT